MKNIITLLLVFPFTASAQQGMPNMNMPGIDHANMPDMMKNMQEMSVCMSKIKPSELKRIEGIARKHDTAVRKLCAAGKRNAAEKQNKKIAEKMLKDPTVIKTNKCQELMAGFTPAEPSMANDDGMHICDQLTNYGQN